MVVNDNAGSRPVANVRNCTPHDHPFAFDLITDCNGLNKDRQRAARPLQLGWPHVKE